MITVKVEDNQLKIYLEKFSPGILKALENELKVQSQLMTDFLATRYLTGGTTADRLGVRTGHLRRSAQPMQIEVNNDSVRGGTGVGEGIPYARTHVKFGGGSTTINMKGKLLTIPLGPARTGAGASKRASAMSYGKMLFPITSKAGNKLLVAKNGKGNIIPYFVLKESVRIPVRVDPNWVLVGRKNAIVSGIQTAISAAMLKG